MNSNQIDTNAAPDNLEIQATEQRPEDPTREPAGAEALGDVVELGLDAAGSVLDGSASSIIDGAAEVAGEAVSTVLGLAADLLSGIFD